MRRSQRCCDGFTLERHYVAGGRRVPPPPADPTFTAARPYYEIIVAGAAVVGVRIAGEGGRRRL